MNEPFGVPALTRAPRTLSRRERAPLEPGSKPQPPDRAKVRFKNPQRLIQLHRRRHSGVSGREPPVIQIDQDELVANTQPTLEGSAESLLN